MSTRLDEIRDIARASLMPDFFAVRIEEEQLYGELQQLIGRIKFPAGVPRFEKLKACAAASASASELIESLKKANLWTTLRDILTHGRIK